MKLETNHNTRAERAAYLATALAGLYSDEPTPAATVGGRRAALQRLHAFDPRPYNRTRNDTVQRGVSHLSPYIRHGVLSLPEIRDYMLTQYGSGEGVAKYVNELGWRMFWQLVYAEHGNRIYDDMEPPKIRRGATQRGVPADIAAAETGLVCIDEGLHELYTEGYMHNHARMWFAAYWQHWRKLDWRDGAHLMYQNLLDGDPASNTLSWQWVGSTFSHKPYFFNKDNVKRFSKGEYCKRCPLAQAGCPFDASYEDLAQQLFGMPLDEVNGERGRNQGKGQRGGRR